MARGKTLPAGGVLIRFRGVKKAFGPKVIFADLNLDLKTGETTTILGASGSGKSVMLKMLIGLIPSDAGEILFDGEDVTKKDEKSLAEVRRRIAYLFQGAALFDSLDVGENVAYGLREQYWNTMTDEEIRQRVAQSLELVGLPGIEQMRPSDLSGGMRRRVGLARAIATDPEVILWDEPTTGLDPISTRTIDELIRSMRAKLRCTSIVVTHDMQSAFTVSDRIAMLANRHIVQVGTVPEMRASTVKEVRAFLDARKGEARPD